MPHARGTTLQPRVKVTRSSVPPQAYAQLSSGTNSSYSFDSDGMRLRTFEGSVWSTMVCDQGDYLAVNRSGADDSLFVLMDGEVLGEILGSEARDYLADPLGSVRGGFDSSQDLQDAMSYWPPTFRGFRRWSTRGASSRRFSPTGWRWSTRRSRGLRAGSTIFTGSCMDLCESRRW